MSNLDNQIKAEIAIAAIDADRFYKFMLWLLSDSEYGALSLYHNYGVLSRVIDLYNRKVCGDEPSRAEWREVGRSASISNYLIAANAAYAGDVYAAYINDEAAHSARIHSNDYYTNIVYAETVALDIADISGARRLQVRKAQLYKLQELKQPKESYRVINKFELS